MTRPMNTKNKPQRVLPAPIKAAPTITDIAVADRFDNLNSPRIFIQSTSEQKLSEVPTLVQTIRGESKGYLSLSLSIKEVV